MSDARTLHLKVVRDPGTPDELSHWFEADYNLFKNTIWFYSLEDVRSFSIHLVFIHAHLRDVMVDDVAPAKLNNYLETLLYAVGSIVNGTYGPEIPNTREFELCVWQRPVQGGAEMQHSLTPIYPALPAPEST